MLAHILLYKKHASLVVFSTNITERTLTKEITDELQSYFSCCRFRQG